MARKGRVKLTIIETQERKDFILSRLRSGFTRHDVQRQFAKKFDYSIETARTWLNTTCDELNDSDIASRRRTFAVIIEMVHAQITSYQNELLAMQREIDKITEIEDARKLISNQLEIASGADHSVLNQRMKLLPEPRLTDKAFLIEAKSRVRERLFRVICELARLQSLNYANSDWKNALFVLLENNLIPGLVAERIESAIEQFDLTMHQQINSIHHIEHEPH